MTAALERFSLTCPQSTDPNAVRGSAARKQPVAVASLLPETNQDPGPAIRSRGDTTWIYYIGLDANRITIGHSRQERGKRKQQHENAGLGIDIRVDDLCEVRGKV